MLRPRMYRPVAAAALAAGLFLTLSGCGGNPKPPSEKTEKKADTTPNTTANSTNPTPPKDPSSDAGKLPPLPPPAAKVDPSTGVGKEATEFITALKNGSAKASQLTTRFVKAVGQPATLPDDKAKGYSADVAEGWLKRAIGMRGFSPFLYSKQVGETALFLGTFIGGDPGSYALRMVNEGGAWKVDWLSLTTAKVEGAAINTSNGDAACQEFTVAAVIGALCDRDAMPKDDRAAVLALGLTPALKAKWAEPLDSDKAQGLDYNRGLLAQRSIDFGKDVEGVTLAAVPGGPTFRVEVSRTNGSKTAYLVKLVPGSAPCLWLVDDVAKQ